MSFHPGGQPKIPNQTPIPHLDSVMDVTGAADGGLPQGPAPKPAEVRSRRQSQSFVRLALINAPILVAGVVVGIVLELPSRESGIWVVLGAAVITGLHTTFVVMRMVGGRSGTGRPAPGAAARAYGTSGTTSPRTDVLVEDAIADAAGDGDVPVLVDTSSATFALEIEDVFSITGRGTVVTGQVSRGELSPGRTVTVLRSGRVVARTQVTGIEAFRQQVVTASVGDRVGLLLADVSRADLARGDVVTW